MSNVFTLQGNLKIPDEGGKIGSDTTDDAITIDSAGNVGIGSTGPTHKLCIGGKNNPILDIHKDDTPNIGAYYRGGEFLGVGYGELGLYTNNGTTRRSMCAFQKVNATDFVCNASSVNFTFNNWVSDDRLKENETPITGAVTTINKLKPVLYDMKSSFDDTDTSSWRKDCGLIVQDVWYDAPELRRMVYPNDCTPAEQNDGPSYSSWGDKPSYFHYHKMVGYLVAAVQELSAENEVEKAKTATLESKVSTLETDLTAEKAKTATLETQMADLLARVTALENP